MNFLVYLDILSILFGKNTAIKTEVLTSQREIIGTLKKTNIDFFTQKSSLLTCPICTPTIQFKMALYIDEAVSPAVVKHFKNKEFLFLFFL